MERLEIFKKYIWKWRVRREMQSQPYICTLSDQLTIPRTTPMLAADLALTADKHISSPVSPRLAIHWPSWFQVSPCTRPVQKRKGNDNKPLCCDIWHTVRKPLSFQVAKNYTVFPWHTKWMRDLLQLIQDSSVLIQSFVHVITGGNRQYHSPPICPKKYINK